MANDKLIRASDARRAILKAEPRLAYCIDNIPSVEAAPVVHGRWIEIDMCACRKCSVCDFVVSDDACSDLYYDWHRAPKYCPECGAKTDGGNQDG